MIAFTILSKVKCLRINLKEMCKTSMVNYVKLGKTKEYHRL
jgi:hypothetical protein